MAESLTILVFSYCTSVASMILLVSISNFAPKLIILTVSLFLEALVGAYDKTKGSRWLSQFYKRTS